MLTPLELIEMREMERKLDLSVKFHTAVGTIIDQLHKKECNVNLVNELRKTTELDYDSFNRKNMLYLLNTTNDALQKLCLTLIKTRPFIAKDTEATLAELLINYEELFTYLSSPERSEMEDWNFHYFLTNFLRLASLVLGIRGVVLIETRTLNVNGIRALIKLVFLRGRLYLRF